MDGDVVAVGEPGNDDVGMNAGVAYAYRYNPSTSQWDPEQTLLAGAWVGEKPGTLVPDS